MDAAQARGDEALVDKECFWPPVAWHETPAAARERWLMWETELLAAGCVPGTAEHDYARDCFDAGFLAGHGVDPPL